MATVTGMRETYAKQGAEGAIYALYEMVLALEKRVDALEHPAPALDSQPKAEEEV